MHITRGALGLIKNEAELAGVLGHEIIHVTAKHTVKSIQKSKAVSLTADEVGGNGLAASAIAKLAEAAYKNIINNAFDRDDEVESDKVGVTLANKVGYAPGALSDVLERIAERNKNQAEPNGMFASHPLIKDRLSNIAKVDQGREADRHRDGRGPLHEHDHVRRQAARGDRSHRRRARPDRRRSGEERHEPRKKKPRRRSRRRRAAFSASSPRSSSEQKQSSQTVASAGARGGVPDRDAKGGSNPNKLTIPVTPAEVAEFKKGIA